MAYPCVHGHCCSSCHLLSVVSGPKVSSSTVTFCPSQDLLCPTTMVCSSSSADDIRPSSAGCMWAGTRVTGTGWEMAVDTGVMEPKGHEDSRRDDENTSRVMEDNQKKGQLHQVACGSLACSHAPSSYISFFHTWLGLPLPPHPFFSVLHFLSSFLSLSFARSTAPLASGDAVRSPRSLCDGGMVCGVKARWSDGGLQHKEKLPSTCSYYCRKSVFIISFNNS